MCSFVNPAAAVVHVCQQVFFLEFVQTRDSFVSRVLTDFALVVHGVVVVFVVRPGPVVRFLRGRFRAGHFLLALALFLLRIFVDARCGSSDFGLAGFGLTLGHGALLAWAFVGSGGKLATLLRLRGLLTLLVVQRALLFLLAKSSLAEALLAWVLLLLLLLAVAVLTLLAIAILVLLSILIFALQLLVVALVFLLTVSLTLTLLAIVVLCHLLTVLLLTTVLRHSFGKLRLKDQVTS